MKKYNDVSSKEHTAHVAGKDAQAAKYNEQLTSIVKEICSYPLKDSEGKRITVKNFDAFETEDVEKFVDAVYKD